MVEELRELQGARLLKGVGAEGILEGFVLLYERLQPTTLGELLGPICLRERQLRHNLHIVECLVKGILEDTLP